MPLTHNDIFDFTKTKSEKEKQIQMIKSGDLHIIVGTHALLGDDVVYSKLGLLVVDEEQVSNPSYSL